jgi:transcriptional regulator with XRE-family HTH domain
MVNAYRNFLRDIKQTLDFRVAGVQNKFAVDVENLMKRAGLKQKELAEKLDVKPAYVSRVLRGESNLSIKSLVKLADALNSEVNIGLIPRERSTVYWINRERMERRPSGQSELAHRWSDMKKAI